MVGETSAGEDAVLVSGSVSTGLWNKNLPAADHKGARGVAACVKTRLIT